jgi:hypothetical protein
LPEEKHKHVNMSKLNLVVIAVLLIFVTISCKSLGGSESKITVTSPIDFSKLGEGKVVLKFVDPDEMDCKQAEQAYNDVLTLEKMGRSVEIEPKMSLAEYKSKLEKKLLECKGSGKVTTYRVNGQSNNVSFSGEICSINKPFSIDAKFPGGTAKTTFSPGDAGGGSTSVSGGGGGCTHSGGGSYKVVFAADGSGTLDWTTSDTIACPGFSNSRTATFTLSLKPAPDLSCPK